MEIQIEFQELPFHEELSGLIRSLFNYSDFSVVEDAVFQRSWIYATSDDNQIFDDDAKNMNHALHKYKINTFYACWISDLLDGHDFKVDLCKSTASAIEAMQNPYSRIDHTDSVFFPDYPASFVVYRPDTLQDLLIAVGEPEFIRTFCCRDGWVIYEKT